MLKFHRGALTALGLYGAAALSLAVFVGPAQASVASKLKAYDTDKDGTLDLKEATAGADATLTALDKDKDGTLDIKELQGRLSKKDFAAADTDHDKTLTKAEYEAAVAQAFKAADTDHDGTLDAKELKSKEGRGLIRLLK